MNAPLPLAWLQPSEDRPARAAAGPEVPGAYEAPDAPDAPEAHAAHATHGAHAAPTRPDAPNAPNAPDARRMVWHSRHGTIEIEVIGQTVYVNGQRVQPAPRTE